MAAPTGKKTLGASYWQQLAGTNRAAVGDHFRSLVACPDDDAPLDYMTQEELFRCPACNREYRPEGGILSLMPMSDPTYQLSAAELERLAEIAPELNKSLADPAAVYTQLWKRLEAVLGAVSGKTVLDLGCGRGWAAAWFARRGAKVAAMDAVTGAGGLADVPGSKAEKSLTVDCIQGDASRLPFIEESLDVIFMGSLIHQLRRPERLMKEISRVLKPDGIVLNIGEPVGEAHQLLDGSSRTLHFADYACIYREGGLSLRCHFGDEAWGATPPTGLLDRLRHHVRTNYTTGKERLLVGQIIPDFQLPEFRLRSRGESKDGKSSG